MAVVRRTTKETPVPKTDTQPAADGGEKAEAKPKAESKKTPIPDGFAAPVEYAKHLSEVRGEEVRPQIVYGYIKNMKDFPFVERDGLPRFIVNVAEADKFLKAKLEAKAERDAKKKAEAEAKKAEEASKEAANA